jgi:Tol biopolymer transport system component
VAIVFARRNAVAFVWDGGKPGVADLYVKLIGPGELVRLTQDGVEKRGVAWSPDGRHIAFVRGAVVAQGDVCIIPALGGPERKIAETPDLASNWYSESPVLAWSPDSRWLVAPDRMPATGVWTLTLVSIDTGEKRRLTTPPQGVTGENSWLGDHMPAISPDGRFLAFRRSLNFVERSGFVVPLAEDLTPRGPPRRFTAPGAYITSLMWTPDSKDILYLQAFDDVLWRAPASSSGTPTPVPSAGHFGLNSQMTISRQATGWLTPT